MHSSGHHRQPDAPQHDAAHGEAFDRQFQQSHDNAARRRREPTLADSTAAADETHRR